MYILEKRQILANGRHEVTYNEFKDRNAAIEWLHNFDDTMSTLQAKGIIHAYRIKLKLNDAPFSYHRSTEANPTNYYQFMDAGTDATTYYGSSSGKSLSTQPTYEEFTATPTNYYVAESTAPKFSIS